MNEYNVKVNFEKGMIQTNLKKLVQNDYNSTKLNFTFDKEGRVLFKMLKPDNSQYVDDIKNNTLIFGPGILSKDGEYTYEISLYAEDGRLTATKEKTFDVRHEIVNTDKIVEVDDRVPILDNLISEANQINNIDIDIENSVITLKRKDGTTKVENVKGDAYEITEEDYEEIETNVKSDIQPILENIENVSKQAEVIAKGKSQSVVKDTWAELEEWLKDSSNKGTHIIGDNLYIKAKYIDEETKEIQPDYWIAEVLEEPNEKGYYYEISELGAEKPDLTEYAKKEQFVTLTNENEYEILATNGTYTREDGTTLKFSANTYYFIPEQEE